MSSDVDRLHPDGFSHFSIRSQISQINIDHVLIKFKLSHQESESFDIKHYFNGKWNDVPFIITDSDENFNYYEISYTKQGIFSLTRKTQKVSWIRRVLRL